MPSDIVIINHAHDENEPCTSECRTPSGESVITILDESAVSEIEARADAATAGDWTIRGGSWLDGGLPLAGYGVRFADASEKYTGWDARTNFPPETPTGKQASADRAFIAHAREDIPALCATVKHLRAEVDRGALCEECEQWEYNEDGSCRTFTVCGACWNAAQSQLEQLRAENERLTERLTEEVEKRVAAHIEKMNQTTIPPRTWPKPWWG